MLPSGTFSAGVTPQFVAIGDFNNDGRRDLVVANQFSANVSILLGNGNGTFQPAVNYNVGQGPVGVAVGDFNGDNRSDLAVANSSTGDVSVMLGNGNGTFGPTNSYMAGSSPSAVVARDFNADNRLDLVVVNRASGDVSVLFGNGDGTFQDALPYSVGVDPVAAAAADFNNDTRSDLAVANAALFDVPPSVSVLLGRQSGGTFQNPVDYNAGISPRSVAVGDFNRDNKPDMAVADYGQISGGTTTNSALWVFYGRGDGTFSNAVSYLAGAGPLSVAVGDFDTNGILDLVVANERSNSVSVLIGNANGTFQPAQHFPAGTHPRSVAVADFNGDGKSDVAVVNDSGVLVLVSSCVVGGDLALTMTDAPDPVTVGSNLVYTLIVTNNGPEPSLDVSVTNRLPPSVSFVSATVSQGSFTVNGGIVVCSLGLMANGAQATITITGNTTAAGPATNSANVASSSTPDLNTVNNAATVVTTVRAVVSVVATDPNASETGPDPGVFTISRNDGTSGSLTVNYTLSGTAFNGSDYSALSGSVTIPSGASSANVTVTPFDDSTVEPVETVILTLSAGANYVVNASASSATVNIADNDVPSLSINDVAVAEGNSGTASAVFTVTLSTAFSQTVTVNYATANGTAVASSDYVATSGVLTFVPGITSQTVTVNVNGDTLNEANETFLVNLSGPSNATIADGQGVGTINNDDSLPSLAINNATVTEGNSGTTPANFTVTLSPASGQSVTVNFATANGTATAGSDYSATNGTLTFVPGITTLTIPVRITGETNVEPDETFFVNLSNPSNATLGNSQGTGTILNDDAFGTLSINDVTVTEGNSGAINATFTVNLSTVLPQTVTVNYATANGTASAGSDYGATSGTLTFPPGNTNQTLTVTVFGDVLSEADETFLVNLSNAINAGIGDSQGVGTILNDDPLPTLSINDVTLVEGNSGTTNAVFTVGLSAASGQSVTVNFATADGSAIAGSDYASTNGTLTFPPGTTSLSLAVRVNGDTSVEANETFFVNLSGASNATITDTQGQGTINNDDFPSPGISISDAIVTERNSGTTNAVFTVSLSGTFPQTVTVNYATANGTANAGSDYAATNGVLTFAPGTTLQTVSVIVFSDVLNEANETFFVNLSNPINSTIADSQGVGTIVNDDPLPSLSINDASVVEGNSGTTNAVFIVNLSEASGQTVTASFATADGTANAGSDYTAASGTLTFAPGVTSQTITVAVIGDAIDEPDENYFVNLSSPANAILADAQGVGTIVSDDAPLPELSINNVTLTEGNSGTTNAGFTVSLSFASTKTVTVNYATANGTALAGSDYAATNGVLTFPPGATDQVVAVTVMGDLVNEPDETFFVNLSGAANATIATNQGVATILNDDPLPTISITDRALAEGNAGTTNANFTLTLSAASSKTVTVNYATANGTAVAGTDYTAASGTVAIAPGTTTQTISVPVSGDLVNEANETFVVNLSNPSNAVIGDGQAVGTIINDDPLPSISINDVSVFEGNSGTTPAVFTVRLSAPSDQVVTVNYATAGGTTVGNDLANISGTLQFSPGQTQQTITVQINGDTRNEDNESFFVNLSSPVNATLADAQGLGIILNDEGVPSISIFDTSLAEGDNGTTNAMFSLRLSAPYSQTVTVGYFTTNGTALAGTDYVATNGIVNFAPGTTNQFVVVRVLSDRMYEFNETFFVNLDGSTNGIVSDAQAVGTIVNDDPLPALSINDVTVTEGNSGSSSATFTVQLSAASALPVTAQFATANGSALAGSDYLAASGTLNFDPGQTQQTVTVTILGDALNEDDETFQVNLTAPSNATIGDGIGVGTILNDDPLPTLAISDVTVTEGNAGNVQAFFTVSLSAPSGRSVSADFSTSDGTATVGNDYQFASGTLSFAPGVTSQTVVVSVFGDLLNEANETFFVNLANAFHATLADSLGQGTILNDDPLPTLSISGVTVAEGNSGTTNAVFTMTLSPVSGQTVTVNYATANGTAVAGSDFAATSGTLIFPPGTTTRTVTVAVQGDLLDEANETFSVNLSGAVNATLNNSQATGTIADDDDAPSASINDVTVTEGSSGSIQAIFTVNLSLASGQTVTLNYSTASGTASAGSDFTAVSGTLTFAPGTTSQTIAVPVLGDALNEANETFFVNLFNPVNVTISDGQGLGTIFNDDPLPALSIGDVAATEGNSGTANAVFTVTLSPVSGQTVTVDFATSDGSAVSGSDYGSASGTLTFPPGVTTQTIVVGVNGDAVFEANENFQVNLSSPVNAFISDGVGIGTINNDDAAPSLSINDVSVTEGDSGEVTAIFTVSLTGATELAASVSYQTANGTATAGTDYLGTNGSLVFPVGTTSQQVAVTVLGDTLSEADETFFVNLGIALNATFAKSQGRGTILSDDPLPTLSISDVTMIEGNSGTSDAVFTVSLSAVSGQSVTVNFATAAGTASAGSDFISTNGVLTFAPGTTSRSIAVKVIGDVNNETDENFFVNLTDAANAVITDSQGVANIINDDPLPGISINNVTLAEGNAGATNALFTVTLTPASGRTVTINYATADGSATAGSDYAATNGVVTFNPGATAQTIAVRVTSDLLNEASETFFINLTNPTNANLNLSQGLGTIVNDDPLPAVTVADVAVAEGNTGSTNAVFTLRLSAASGQSVSLRYATADGSASAATDYSSTNGLVTFAPGATNQSLAVAVFGDLVFETNETFFVNLSSPTNATLADSQAIGTIVNDDPVPSITVSNVALFEGNSGTVNAVFVVQLSSPSALPVTVNYATADGTAKRQDNDYERISNTQLQFAAGQTSQGISVIVNGDTSAETNETFFVNFSSPVNATLGTSQAVGTILNDDGVPFLTITDATLVEGNSGTTNALFTVRLSASSSDVVTVNYATANGTALAGADYLATNGVVSFPAGTTNRTIAVRVVGDQIGESNKTFFVNLSGSVNALISDGTALGTIVDDDPISFLLSTNAISVGEGSTNSFSVRLLSAPASSVSVTTTRTSGSTNLSVFSGGTLTFTPANWNVFQPVIIAAAEDANTTNETATFTVSNGGSQQTVTVTDVDNDAEQLEITSVAVQGADVVIQFTTSLGPTYRVERSDSLSAASWLQLGGDVSGTGSVATVTDVGGAGQPSRYYRVVRLSGI